jgi:hypothetical protein
MTAPATPMVKINRVGRTEALHEILQVKLWGLEKEMEMVVHDYKGMQFEAIKPEAGG